MDDPAVMQPLHEPHVLGLRERRAHACLNRACATLGRAHFGQARLHVTREDCSYGNALFVLRPLLDKNPGVLLCVQNETVYPELKLHITHWMNRKEDPISLDNVQYATIYFLGRALASYSVFRFMISGLNLSALSLRIHCAGIDAQLLHRNINSVGIHALVSAFHEHVALHSLMGLSNGAHWCRNDNLTKLSLEDMRMDNLASEVVGARLTDQRYLADLSLNTTTPWANTHPVQLAAERNNLNDMARKLRFRHSICGYVFGGTDHVFAALKKLDVQCNPVCRKGAYVFAKALINGRFPALEDLNMHNCMMDESAMEMLGPGLHAIRDQLTQIVLSGNPLRSLGINTFIDHTTHARHLHTVGLAATECGDWVFERLAERMVARTVWPAIEAVDITDSNENETRAEEALKLAIDYVKARHQWDTFIEQTRENNAPLGLAPANLSDAYM